MTCLTALVSTRHRLRAVAGLPVVMAAALLAPAAQATTLYATGPMTPLSGVALSPTTFNNGFQFTTDAAAYALESLTVLLFDPTPGAQTLEHQVFLAPFADLSARQTLSFETTLQGDTLATADSVTLSLSGWTLQPSTRYVIGFYGPSTMQVVTGRQPLTLPVLAPGWTTGPSVREGTGGVLLLNGAIPNAWFFYPAVTLTGESAAPIPEPSAFWLALAGLGGLGWRLRAAARGQRRP